MTWQPIEPAPKDGTPILGARVCKYPDGSIFLDGAIMMYERGLGKFHGWALMGWEVVMVDEETQPTHWMPLPEPPK